MRRYWPAMALLAVLAAAPAWARTMVVMESRPAASAVMDGSATDVFVRFDGPVDHASATLGILHDGLVVARLHPRLNSQPNTLYAAAGRLPPGAYTLHWTARSAQDHDASAGDIAFTVR